jgi:hypothetical protein
MLEPTQVRHLTTAPLKGMRWGGLLAHALMAHKGGSFKTLQYRKGTQNYDQTNTMRHSVKPYQIATLWHATKGLYAPLLHAPSLHATSCIYAPLVHAPKDHPTGYAPGHIHKHYTRLKSPDRD